MTEPAIQEERRVSLQRRDGDGLMLNQRKLLSELALEPDLRRACTQAGVKLATAKAWLQRDEAFGHAFDQLLGPSLDLAKALMESAATRASGVYEEALTATKIGTVEAKCPDCDRVFETEAQIPDWHVRLRAADIVMKVGNILIDRKQIEQTNVVMTVEERFALELYRRGASVPPNIISRLDKKGLLNAVNPDPGE